MMQLPDRTRGRREDQDLGTGPDLEGERLHRRADRIRRCVHLDAILARSERAQAHVRDFDGARGKTLVHLLRDLEHGAGGAHVDGLRDERAAIDGHAQVMNLNTLQDMQHWANTAGRPDFVLKP